jgi:glycosyltransferase domain-containing protein
MNVLFGSLGRASRWTDHGEHALITILLNSHNRPEPMKLVLEALADAPARVIILDSSSPENRAAIRRFSDCEIRTFSEDAPPFAKLAAGSNLVNTEFVQTLSDDDIPNAATLAPMRDFLLANPDYSACYGRNLYGQRESTGRFKFWLEFQTGFEAESPLDRMRALMSGWTQLFFALQRTDVNKAAYSAALTVDPLGRFLGERLVSLYMLLAGKVALLPTPTLIRSSHVGSISSILKDHRRTFLARGFGAGYDRFVAHLIARMNATLPALPRDCEQWISLLIADHLAYWYLPAVEHRHPIKSEALAAFQTDSRQYFERLPDADRAVLDLMQEKSRRMLTALANATGNATPTIVT